MSTPGPCASSDERDTQDSCRRSLAGSAIRKTRRRGLLRPETLHAQEGSRLGVQRLWAALAGLAALELRRRRSTVHAAPTKNEEK
jgi:MYXO-CTERM domain-containing protein